MAETETGGEQLAWDATEGVPAPDAKKGSDLIYAARFGDVEAVKTCLEVDKVPLGFRDGGGWTALKWAAQMGDAAVVRVLLEAGAADDAAEGEGSALMVAAENLRAEAVEELVARGSPLEACDEQGWTATAIAAGSLTLN